MPPSHDLARWSRSDESSRPAGQNPLLLVGTIVGAKVATIVVVLAMERSVGTGVMVAATTWHWFVVIGALVAAPVALTVRLRRVRSRRADLLRAEWYLDDSSGAVSPSAAAPRVGRTGSSVGERQPGSGSAVDRPGDDF